MFALFFDVIYVLCKQPFCSLNYNILDWKGKKYIPLYLQLNIGTSILTPTFVYAWLRYAFHSWITALFGRRFSFDPMIYSYAHIVLT